MSGTSHRKEAQVKGLARPPLRHPADRAILRLAVPALGALIAEPLFLLADSAIVARLGVAQLAGLGVAGVALVTLVNLCVFLAYGTTAAVARRVGAGDLRGALAQGIDGLWLAAGLGLVVLIAGQPLASTVVDAFGTSAEVTPYAITYLRVSLLGIPAMLLVLAASGVLRGLQDTRTPLVVAVAAAAVNLALDVLFVPVLGFGIAGSAWATVLAQTGAAAAYLAMVVRGARRHEASLRPDLPGIRTAARAGGHLVVRTLSLRVVLVAATAVATRIGDAELAAYQVAFAVWSLLALALDAIAIAGQAIVGLRLGAADVPGARAATRRMIEWGVAAGVVTGVLVVALRPAYVPLLVPDPRVQELLAAALIVVAVLQPVAGVVFVLDGVLIGAGDARYLAAAGVLTVVAFLPAAWAVLAFGGGLVALWWALGVWMIVRLAVLGVRASGDAWLVTGAVRR
jgi:putative MATE family efflux protein